MSAVQDKLENRLAFRKRLKYVFASRIGGIIGGFAVIDSLVLFFVALSYGALVYQAQAVNAMTSFITPHLELALDGGSDAERFSGNLPSFLLSHMPL